MLILHLSHSNINKLLHVNQFIFTEGRNSSNTGTKLIAIITEARKFFHEIIGVFAAYLIAFEYVIIKLKI